MSGLRAEDVARLARLSHLETGDDEAARLAGELAAIVATFGTLSEHAATLPPPAESVPSGLRPDEVGAAPADVVAGILAAVPDADASGAVRVRRRP